MYIDHSKHGCILWVRLIWAYYVICGLSTTATLLWVVTTYNHMLTARTMIRYWNGLATPAWGSQTQVEYQLIVETSVEVPTLEIECQLVSITSKLQKLGPLTRVQVDSPMHVIGIPVKG